MADREEADPGCSCCPAVTMCGRAFFRDRSDALAARPEFGVGLQPAFGLVEAVGLFFGLREALKMIFEEGLEAKWTGVSRRAGAVREALAAMGLRLVSRAPSDAVTGAFYPEGVGDEVRHACRTEHAVALARERQCRMVQLTSNKQRPDALKFYERIGFQPSHVGFKLYL